MSLGIAARVVLGIGVMLASVCMVANEAHPAGDTVCPDATGGEPALRKCSPRIVDLLASPQPPATLLVWIFIADRPRGGIEAGRAAGVRSSSGVHLPSEAVSRRLARAHAAYDDHYLPVHGAYIDALRSRIIKLRHVSSYFNAVSAVVATSELPAISAYPFVERIEQVAVFSSRVEPPPYVGRPSGARAVASPAAEGYGGSIYQLDQIWVIPLLEKGYNGSGTVSGNAPVHIGVLDTGFNRDHAAFSHVTVDAEWDFVQGDAVTRNEPGDLPNQDEHGTWVLGVIAGYAPGRLIGPAWGAHYFLAKTEIANVRDERVEEDNWVAGIEWADTNGADIVTSSLAFKDWYTRGDLDGQTALCTRAADIIASHGVIVVNSAGNSGILGLVAPADGDSVFSIGAVDRLGTIASFSSRGPTADGRIKPDFVAMGVDAWTVSASDPTAYRGDLDGTSFSGPLFAGGCALLLEMHPDWDPAKVREELRATASNSGSPDNTYGWGIPNFQLAGGCTSAAVPPGAFPNPFVDMTKLQFFYRSPQLVTVRVYDCRGALVRTLASNEPKYCAWDLSWDGTSDAGAAVTPGVYFVAVTTNSTKTTFKLIRIR